MICKNCYYPQNMHKWVMGPYFLCLKPKYAGDLYWPMTNIEYLEYKYDQEKIK